MKEVVIACLMMEAEMRDALARTGSEAEVVWMEKGLHNRPEKLRAALQAELDRVEKERSPDRILLGYGFCGNAMQGLRAGSYQLVLPRIDDCITLFIGSRERKAALEGGVGTMFQTSNWADGDKSILAQRDALIEEYDEDEGMELFEMMYGNYKRIAVLDTHCYPLDPVIEESRHIAEELGFEHCVFDASNQYLVDLLTGNWDENRFIIKQPGEMIVGQDLRI